MQHFKSSQAAPSLQQMLMNPLIRRKPIPQLQQHPQPPQVQRSTGVQEPKEKYMRLRGKARILHNSYLQNGEISERDTDVVFLCSNGQIRAHKVILATATMFFNDLFNGQTAGSMTSVSVPDVSLDAMRVILLLAYRDNLNLTRKQMKDVAAHLPMFGMDVKSFVFDENNLAEQSGVTVSPVPPIRRPPPMTIRPNPPPPLQPQSIQRQIGSITISGTGRLTQPGLTLSRQSIGGTSSGGDSEDDYKLPFQGYDALTPPPLKQIRISTNPQGLVQAQVFKKQKLVNVGNFRRIAPKPPEALPIQPAMNMTVGNQEIQFDDNNDEDDGQVLDPEKGRLMIQEWMQNVGQEDGLGTRSASSTAAAQPQRNQCLICNNVFENPDKWRWHESHHVGLGIFKCAFCDELFSTSRKVYQHEMMEHGVSGTGTPLEEPPAIPSDFQIVQGRKRRIPDEESQTDQNVDGISVPRMTLVRTANGTHYRRIPTPMSKKLLSKYAKKPLGGVVRNFNPSIGIGVSEGEELLEDRKIKQLHWVYVCSKCQTCSDSLGKAQAHYSKCYPEKIPVFESTVMKYRQGFYGRSRCPLCPRRYTTNHGFTIHCGHQHHSFRRKFQHCSQNDTIACISCRKKFKVPHEFKAHLGDDGECNAAPEFCASDNTTKWIGNETPGERKSPSASGSKKEKDAKSSAGRQSSTKVTPPTGIQHGRTAMESQARSTRLANRRTMTTEAEIPEEEFIPVDCPICGSVEPKIVKHLHTMHKEMELSVSRISNTALRCMKCAISFGITDLVSHDTYCCIRSKQFQHVKERKLQHPKSEGSISAEKEKPSATTGLASTSANGLNPNPPIPEGIGSSPVDMMETEDLLSPDTIQRAMRCGVCGRINTKLGTIAECLKSHGIYRCALCFNSYSDRNTYSTHIRSVHTLDNGRLKCPLCDKANFVNAGQVAGHLYNMHWEAIFRQIFAEDAKFIPPKRQKGIARLQPRQIEKLQEVKESAEHIDDSVLEEATKGSSVASETPAESEIEKVIEMSQEGEESDDDGEVDENHSTKTDTGDISGPIEEVGSDAVQNFNQSEEDTTEGTEVDEPLKTTEP